MHVYDSVFYDYINLGSKRSAERVIPILLDFFPINSVVDFGCGQGAWISVWSKLGVKDHWGIDGGYVDGAALLFGAERFVPADLKMPIALGRKFDLVQSLEVAEHIPESSAEIFVDNLVIHGDLVFFSAGVPGDGGEDHQNEQPYEYWRKLFRKRGFVVVDLLRPRMRHDTQIEAWYRYNCLLYVREERLHQLPPSIQRWKVADDMPIKDVSPVWYRLRKAILKHMPISFLTRLAVLKKLLYVNMRRWGLKL